MFLGKNRVKMNFVVTLAGVILPTVFGEHKSIIVFISSKTLLVVTKFTTIS